MIRNIIGALLIVLVCVAGGAWLYQDCLNKKEQEMSEMSNQHLAMQARAETKKKADAKASFEHQLNANLASCQAAADKAYADYSALIQQTAPIKRGVAAIPLAVTEGAVAAQAAAKAECQQIHDTRLKNGQ